jgi:hypothetical protein
MHQFPDYTPEHDGQPAVSAGRGLLITWQDGPFQSSFGPNGSMPEQPVRALIHRITDLHSRIPCVQNQEIIVHLNAVLGLLDERARERNSRGVLGTLEP